MKAILLMFILSIALIHSYAQKHMLSFDYEARLIESTKPIRTVTDEGAFGVTVNYQFPGASYFYKFDNNDTFQFMNIEGFSHLQEIGKPSLPAHSDLILIPDNGVLSLQVSVKNSSSRSNFWVYPALTPASDKFGDHEPNFTMDSNYYFNGGDQYPASVVQIKEYIQIKGLRFARIEVCPIQFNPTTKKITVYEQVEYKVNFSGAQVFIEDKYAFSNDFLRNLSNIALNNMHLKTEVDHFIALNQKSFSQDPNYIIVTHSDYLQAADSIAHWKRQMGYNVEIVSSASWTSNSVKNTIHSKYLGYSPSPDYVLIIGDHNKVPGEVLTSSGATFASDLYYVCMDGTGDYVPDMSLGRISVTTPTMAQSVISKIIDYERNPISDSVFYQKGLNCAYFQESSTNGYAERRFAQTSEDVLNHLSGYGYTIERVYTTGNSTYPTNWNNGLYSAGESIPTYLQKPGFAWNGNYSDINNAINEGRFYVLHRDHGLSAGWGDPHYMKNNVGQLNNGNKLPVVFSINCLTGKFMDAECFAEKFLRHGNGGAVGVFAHGEVSYSGYNDGLALGLFDAMFDNPGLVPNFTGSGGVTNPTLTAHSTVLKMGDVKNQGLIRMIETWGGSSSAIQYTHELFNYFGDPAMRIWTETPAPIVASHVDTIHCSNDSTLVISGINISSGIATIVVDNELISVASISNGTATLSWDNISGTEAYLTITEANKAPYIAKLVIEGGCPKARFSVTANKFCLDDSVFVEDLSSGNIATYAWNFGQGALLATSTGTGPFYVQYITDGNKTITLTVTDSVGNTASYTQDFYIDQYCTYQIPATGNLTIDKCSGKLFDDGGALNYSNNSLGSVTITSTGAASVNLNFVSFNFENNYDYLKIYDGPTTSSPLIGSYTGVALPNNGYITSTTGSITIEQSTDSDVNESGFELNWQCNMANTMPSVSFAVKDSVSCSGEVKFFDASSNGPTSWLWDFGDGTTSTLQNPTHHYTSNGFYHVKLVASNSFGVDSMVQHNLVYINQPNSPVAVDGIRCKTGTVDISTNYTGNGTIHWFDSPTSTTLLDTGLIFETPVISSNTTFYAEVHEPSSVISAGKPDNVGSGSYFTGGEHYLVFDCYKEMKLHAVTVYSNVAKNRTFKLENSAGNLIHSVTVFVPVGQQRVILDFDLPIGSNLRLVGPSSPNLYRNNGGTNYPYTVNGVVNIKHSSAGSNPTGYYYFFYDWELLGKDCVSPRTAILAEVSDSLKPTSSFSFQNQDPVIHFTNLSEHADSYHWKFGDNDFDLTENPVHTYLNDGTYTVELIASNQCGNVSSTQQITIMSSSISDPVDFTFVSVYPNPAHDQFTLAFDLISNEQVDIELVNMVGQVVWTQNGSYSSGRHDITVDLSAFANGVYSVRIKTDKGIVSRRLIHQ
jgi:PKD repeat protein